MGRGRRLQRPLRWARGAGLLQARQHNVMEKPMCRFPAVAIGAAILMSSLATSSLPAHADPRVEDLVRAGRIRIGVFPSFQYAKDSAGQPHGLAIGVARVLAARLGIADVVTLEHPTPPQVIACVKTNGCDLGFMLIDPARATEVDFT